MLFTQKNQKTQQTQTEGKEINGFQITKYSHYWKTNLTEVAKYFEHYKLSPY